MLNEDYKEMLRALEDNGVEFLVVGAYAMSAYGHPRATGDIDIWVSESEENSSRVFRALRDFGALTESLDESTFRERGVVFQIGVNPRRIDIITQVDGVVFDEAFESREIVDVNGVKVPLLSRVDLVRNKKATGRKKDQLDAEVLEGE